MVPSCNHDFAQYSWLTAVMGVAKLAVILVAALCLLLVTFMVLFADRHRTECPEDNSIEYEDCILPD